VKDCEQTIPNTVDSLASTVPVHLCSKHHANVINAGCGCKMYGIKGAAKKFRTPVVGEKDNNNNY